MNNRLAKDLEVLQEELAVKIDENGMFLRSVTSILPVTQSSCIFICSSTSSSRLAKSTN